MAEIKSTMEMVLERAARMAAGAADNNYLGEEQLKEGMRLGAAYMRDEGPHLGERLGALPLLVARVGANDMDHALAADDLAFETAFFD